VEGVSEAAVDLEAVVNCGLDGDFVWCAFHAEAAGAGVKVAGVFADDGEVDFVWAFVLDGGLDAGVELYRAQVDVLVKPEACL